MENNEDNRQMTVISEAIEGLNEQIKSLNKLRDKHNQRAIDCASSELTTFRDHLESMLPKEKEAMQLLYDRGRHDRDDEDFENRFNETFKTT